MTDQKDAWEIDAVMIATDLLAKHEGVHAEFITDPNKQFVIMTVFDENMERIRQEWNDAVEARAPQFLLRKLMNAQVYELGLEILKRMELIQ